MARLGNVSFFIIDESHQYDNEITDHPVEDGGSVSDHVTNKPNVYTITGECAGSDSPAKHLELRRLRDSGEPSTYVGRGLHSSMVIETLETSRDIDISNGFRFTMTIKHVQVSKTSTVDLLTPPVRAQVRDVSDAGRVQAA